MVHLIFAPSVSFLYMCRFHNVVKLQSLPPSLTRFLYHREVDNLLSTALDADDEALAVARAALESSEDEKNRQTSRRARQIPRLAVDSTGIRLVRWGSVHAVLWKMAEDEPETVQGLLRNEIANNWIVETGLSVAEAREKWPLGIAVGKLNVVFAEKKKPS